MEYVTEKIIRYMLSQNTYRTAKQIAANINVSESSVKHNIAEAKTIISKSGGSLLSVPGKGFILESGVCDVEMLKDKVFQLINQSDSYAYRQNYILNILFMRKSNYTIHIFSDDLGVSRNTILYDLESIEKWLYFYNIKLIRVRNFGITVEGDEFDIREAIMDSNKQLMEFTSIDIDRPDDFDLRISKTFFNYFSKFYSDSNLYNLQNLLKKAEERLNTHFADASFIQLIEYLAILKRRVNEGNIIVKKNILSKYKSSYVEYSVAKDLIYTLFPITDKFLTMEIHCLAIQFTLYGCYDRASHGVYEEEYYIGLAVTLLKNIQNVAQIEMSLTDDMITNIANLFIKKQIRESYQPVPNKYLINDIKTNLSSIYGVVLANMRLMEDSFHFTVKDTDVAYIAMLIDNAKIEKKELVKTLFITSFDKNISAYLKNKIERNVHNISIIKIMEFEDYNVESFKDYDLVLTTVLMENQTPIKISRRVDQVDLDRIQKAVNEKVQNRYRMTIYKQSLFDENLILVNHIFKKKEDAIKAGCALLEKFNYVTKDFFNILIERENIVPTTIGKGIAMPHGFKKGVLKSGVAIIKLKNPLEWNEKDKVDLIFIFAINLDNRKEVMTLFQNFYRLVSEDVNLINIKNCTTSAELLEYIKNAK